MIHIKKREETPLKQSIHCLNEKNASKAKNIKRQNFKFAFFVFYFIFFILVFSISEVSASVLKPTSDFYVNDNAGLLTTDTKQYIINTNIELQKKTGAQIVVVTVKSLEGKSIEDYANELFNSWGIGDKTKDNGLLLLCSYRDREFRVEVGYGLEGKLPDGKTGRMQDEYIIPYLKENKFNEGIKNGYSAFLKEVAEEYGVTITSSETANRRGVSTGIQVRVMISFILFYILITIIRIKFGGRGRTFHIFWRRRRRILFWRRFSPVVVDTLAVEEVVEVFKLFNKKL